MLEFRKKVKLFSPLLAVYFVLSGIILSHPASHNITSDIFSGLTEKIVLLENGNDEIFPASEKSVKEDTDKRIIVGMCFADDLLLSLNSIFFKKSCSPVNPNIYTFLISAYDNPVFSEIAASGSNRAPPTVL